MHFQIEMTNSPRKSLMRNLGEFFGNVWKGVKTDPSKRKQVLNTDMQEEKRGDVTLRRTTIEEIELRNSDN